MLEYLRALRYVQSKIKTLHRLSDAYPVDIFFLPKMISIYNQRIRIPMSTPKGYMSEALSDSLHIYERPHDQSRSRYIIGSLNLI